MVQPHRALPLGNRRAQSLMHTACMALKCVTHSEASQAPKLHESIYMRFWIKAEPQSGRTQQKVPGAGLDGGG